MKSMLALVLVCGSAALMMAQDLSKPLPSVIQSALPAGTPAPTLVSHPTNWSSAYSIPMETAHCEAPQALCPVRASGCWAHPGSAFERLRNWLTFSVCEPNHCSLVPTPYHAPLRHYFPIIEMPLGFNGPLSCSPRARVWGWEPKHCASAPACTTPTCTTVTARPATQIVIAPPPAMGCETTCGPFERRYVFRRLVSVFSFEGCGLFHRCGFSRTPMACQGNGCPTTGCAASPGQFGYHYAGNQSPMIYPGVPAPASPTKPFTNP